MHGSCALIKNTSHDVQKIKTILSTASAFGLYWTFLSLSDNVTYIFLFMCVYHLQRHIPTNISRSRRRCFVVALIPSDNKRREYDVDNLCSFGVDGVFGCGNIGNASRWLRQYAWLSLYLHRDWFFSRTRLFTIYSEYDVTKMAEW